jgi:fructose-bisphosphate aldolase class I
LQHSCLKAWKGSDVEGGQKALIARAQANSEASKGAYVAGSQPSSDEQLFVAGYTY